MNILEHLSRPSNINLGRKSFWIYSINDFNQSCSFASISERIMTWILNGIMFLIWYMPFSDSSTVISDSFKLSNSCWGMLSLLTMVIVTSSASMQLSSKPLALYKKYMQLLCTSGQYLTFCQSKCNQKCYAPLIFFQCHFESLCQVI